jgi:hypothetical protein
MTPQIIYLFLLAANLLLVANLHGKDRAPHNFWLTLLGASIGFMLLLWGGFFDVFFSK